MSVCCGTHVWNPDACSLPGLIHFHQEILEMDGGEKEVVQV